MADSDEEWSDDDIYFGKMTLKEVKRNLGLPLRTSNYTSRNEKAERNSIKIIETHSEPNLRSSPVSHPSSPPISARDDESFIKTVKTKEDNVQMNSANLKKPKQSPKKEILSPKMNIQTEFKTSPKYYTPAQSPHKEVDVFITPSQNMQRVEPTFKTPCNPLKKPSVSSQRPTTSKFMYKDIKSHVAAYIQNSIQSPLITNVYPKKLLPGPSSLIPKLIKSVPESKQSKENKLPTVAYKTAKKTKVVQAPVEGIPKRHRVKKILSNPPKPQVVLIHEAREFNSAKKPMQHFPDDTIADLSCLQAERSNYTSRNEKAERNSIKIIETHSEPNLRSSPVSHPSSPPISARDDESFIKTVKTKEDNVQMNSANLKTEKDIKIKKTYSENSAPKQSSKKKILSPKMNVQTEFKTSPKYYTPAQSPHKEVDVFITPSQNMQKVKRPTFKTPRNPLKKPSVSSQRPTTSKFMYKDIKSRVGAYIQNSIQSPLITNVYPKKPLPGHRSLIPKLIKSVPESKQSKENKLPTVAYKTAKKRKVVQAPVEGKPKRDRVKKILSNLPKPPVVLKHEAREFNSAKKPMQHFPDDTIADLSCLQADLSICTPLKPKNK